LDVLRQFIFDGGSMSVAIHAEESESAGGRWWNKFVARDSSGNQLATMPQQTVEEAQVCADLREAMRLWDEDRKVQLQEQQSA
jgi:hypothetical protein